MTLSELLAKAAEDTCSLYVGGGEWMTHHLPPMDGKPTRRTDKKPPKKRPRKITRTKPDPATKGSQDLLAKMKAQHHERLGLDMKFEF